MRKAAIVVSRDYTNNKLFSRSDSILVRDDCLYSFYHLRNELYKVAIELNTQDITDIETAEIVIFNDMPQPIPKKRPGQKFYLLALESIAVHPINFDTSRYEYFDKVFTWYDNVIDGINVVKINYSFLFKTDFPLDLNAKTKLVCMMANNKRSSHHDELYEERKRAIAWFERLHPDDFDLFGNGWDQPLTGTLLGTILRRLRVQKFFRRKIYSCHRGIAEPKLPVLRRYKFNICFENVKNVPGYITEKIFDCFFTGCIPIYWGANNVTEYIPRDCFIDMRNFSCYETLYAFLKNMSDDEYVGYLKNIRHFLTSADSYPFTSECFAKTIVNEIIG